MAEAKKNKQYKVTCYSITGKNVKVFRCGQIVSENQFPEGVADKYVRGGQLKLVSEDAPKEKTSNELKEALTEAGVEYNKSAKKAELKTLLDEFEAADEEEMKKTLEDAEVEIPEEAPKGMLFNMVKEAENGK
jgi:hypothetical protein